MIVHAENTSGATGRSQTRRRKWPWVLGGLAVAALLLGLASPTVIWDGGVSRPISVLVLDSEDGHAISGATVVLDIPHDRAFAEHLSPQEMIGFLTHDRRLTTSDERGQAILHGQFGAGGSYSFFGRTGKFGVEGFLRVSHHDYRTSEDLLQNYLGERRFSIGTKQLNIRICLARPAK